MGTLLTIRTFWYYLYVNMTKWQASRNIIYLYKLSKRDKKGQKSIITLQKYPQNNLKISYNTSGYLLTIRTIWY